MNVKMDCKLILLGAPATCAVQIEFSSTADEWRVSYERVNTESCMCDFIRKCSNQLQSVVTQVANVDCN